MAKRDTKQILINSFVELARTKSIDKITVKQISENCGVTSQTFYNHFPDKYELVFWAYRKRVDIVFEKYYSGSVTREEGLKEYICGFKNNSEFIINAFHNMNGQDSYINKTCKYLIQKMEKSYAEMKQTDRLPEKYRVYIKMYVFGMMNIIASWLAGEINMDEDEIVTALIKCLPQELVDFVRDNSIN